MGKRKRERKELIQQGREDLVHRSTIPPTTATTADIFLSLFHPDRLRIPGGGVANEAHGDR